MRTETRKELRRQRRRRNNDDGDDDDCRGNGFESRSTRTATIENSSSSSIEKRRFQQRQQQQEQQQRKRRKNRPRAGAATSTNPREQDAVTQPEIHWGDGDIAEASGSRTSLERIPKTEKRRPWTVANRIPSEDHPSSFAKAGGSRGLETRIWKGRCLERL